MTGAPPPAADKSNVHRLPVGGVESFVRVGPRSISLGQGDDVCNWDRAGRPLAGAIDGVTWHRALDGRIVHITVDTRGRHARWMPEEETREWIEKLRRRAEQVRDAGRAGGVGAVALAFEPAASFDAGAWAKDAAAFAAVYQPVRVLPPDQYLALALQATIGCSWNRCVFCDLYRDRKYSVRPPEELRAHALAVRDFFGPGLAVRRSIFIADANAIAAPTGRVVEWLRVVRELFPVRVDGGLSCEPRESDPPTGFDGIHAFLDVAGGITHLPDDWVALAEEGLTRVCIGVETGHDPLLRTLGKPGRACAARDLVASLKRAGIGVSLVFLSGVGGREMSADHVRESAAFADGLALDKDDLLYIAPYSERPNARYREVEQQAGLTPLSIDEAWEQAEQLKQSLRCLTQPGGPRAAIFDINLFAY